MAPCDYCRRTVRCSENQTTKVTAQNVFIIAHFCKSLNWYILLSYTYLSGLKCKGKFLYENVSSPTPQINGLNSGAKGVNMFCTSTSLKTEDCERWGLYISIHTVYTDGSKECAASTIDHNDSYFYCHYLQNFKSHSVLGTVQWTGYATTVSMICKTQNMAAVYIQNKQRAMRCHLVIYVCMHALHDIKPASKQQPDQNLQ